MELGKCTTQGNQLHWQTMLPKLTPFATRASMLLINTDHVDLCLLLGLAKPATKSADATMNKLSTSMLHLVDG